MATPKPGEIRCPTCHRSTPPAAFCTQCGSAIPPDARIRPRGMDREELQERIRARRLGGEPYRRGGMADDEYGYERFEPEPEDERARQLGTDHRRRDHFAEGPVAPPPLTGAERRDLTRDDDEWDDRTAVVPAAASRVDEHPAARPEEPERVDRYADTAYDEDAYAYDDEYEEWEERDRRGAGAGAFAILGFLALGVLALVGGAVLAGVFNGDPAVGEATPSPPPAMTTGPATTEPSPDAGATVTASPPPGESPQATREPSETEGPVVFPDGFVAEAQPCLPGSAGTNGCDSNARSNSGSLWVWVGFRNGTQDDVIGAELIGPEGNVISDGSIDLARIGCTPTCPGGWTYFPFSNLAPGEYEVRITRNGQPAGTTSFEVT